MSAISPQVQTMILNEMGVFIKLISDGHDWYKARMAFWRYIFDTKQCKVDWYSFKRIFNDLIPENLEG